MAKMTSVNNVERRNLTSDAPRNNNKVALGENDWRTLESALRDYVGQLAAKRNTAIPPEDLKAHNELNRAFFNITGRHAVAPILSSLNHEPALKNLPPEVLKGKESLLEVMRQNVTDALAADDRRDIQEAKLKELRFFSWKRNQTSLTASIEQQLKAIRDERKVALQSNPDAFYALHAKTMNNWLNQLKTGRIVILPYVQKAIDQGLKLLSRTNTLFYHGETGTGKTEVARIVAKMFSGKDPVVVRGYSGMGSSELFGHMELSAGGGQHNALEAVNAISKEIAEWDKLNRKASKGERDRAHRTITEKVIHENAVTISQFMLAGAYLAAEEGRVLLKDESNYIPPPLNAKMNDVTTKKPGEKVSIQEDGSRQTVVKQGFGIIETGNISIGNDKRYKDRYEIEASHLNRIGPGLIEYGFLPQAADGGMEAHPYERKQLFAAALASLATACRTKSTLKNPNAPDPDKALLDTVQPFGLIFELPDGEKGLEKVWRLCQLARITEDVFEGKVDETSPHAFMVEGGAATNQEIKNVLAVRSVVNILDAWKREGFQYELDHYLYETLIAPALSSRERAYLYQRSQFCDFFKSEGWEQAPDYSDKGLRCFHVEDPCNPEKAIDLCPTDSVIRAIFGKPPERGYWPETKKSEVDENQEQMKQLLNLRIEFEKDLADVRQRATEFPILIAKPQKEADSQSSETPSSLSGNHGASGRKGNKVNGNKARGGLGNKKVGILK